MERFKAYRLTETPDKKIRAEFVDTTLDQLDPGDVTVRVAYSSVNYKDALAATVKGDWLTKLPPGLSLWEAMAFGTAGYTAGIAVVRMEHNGLAPAKGPVVVSGATGGGGSVAVAAFAR